MLGVAIKIHNIIQGWHGWAFDSVEAEQLARQRARICGECEFAVEGIIPSFMDDKVEEIKGLECAKCNCPLSTLLRAPDANCKINKW